MLSRRVLNRTLVNQINREEVPPGNNQKGLLEGKPTVQLNRTLGIPDFRVFNSEPQGDREENGLSKNTPLDNRFPVRHNPGEVAHQGQK